MNDDEKSGGKVDDAIESSLRRIAIKLPKPVRFRIENAFLHIDRALILLPIDREMASFRAITAEEEAVTALLTALRLRNYPHWKRLNTRFHTHKAAVLIAVQAIQLNYSRGLKTIQLVVDIAKRRIDVKIPLSEFGVHGPKVDDLCIQPVEPLDLLHTRQGVDGAPGYTDDFDMELAEIVTRSNASDLWQLVTTTANQRNLLLYASDSGLPKSQFTPSAHAYRKGRVIMMVALTIMVLQSSKHQATVIQAMRALLKMVSRMPSDAA